MKHTDKLKDLLGDHLHNMVEINKQFAHIEEILFLLKKGEKDGKKKGSNKKHA